MKLLYYIAILLCLFISENIFAQTINELDAKKGFQSIILGTHKDSIMEKFNVSCPKIPDGIDEKGRFILKDSNRCIVENNPYNFVFDVPVKQLSLHFNDEKILTEILIELKSTSTFNTVLTTYENFKVLFGKYSNLYYESSTNTDINSGAPNFKELKREHNKNHKKNNNYSSKVSNNSSKEVLGKRVKIEGEEIFADNININWKGRLVELDLEVHYNDPDSKSILNNYVGNKELWFIKVKLTYLDNLINEGF